MGRYYSLDLRVRGAAASVMIIPARRDRGIDVDCKLKRPQFTGM
jgi:hypothetical protein